MTGTERSSHSPLRWAIHYACPPDWRRTVTQCRGNFFHTSRGLFTITRLSDPVFLELYRDDALVGIAAALAPAQLPTNARRQLYFPTLPVLSDDVTLDEAVTMLLDDLAFAHYDEAVFDSFDSDCTSAANLHAVEIRGRREYVIPLDDAARPAGLSFSMHHQRAIARAEERGMHLLTPDRVESRMLLRAVSRMQAGAPHDTGAFVPQCGRLANFPSLPLTSPCGSSIFAAAEDRQCLAAAMVGWAGQRAYCVMSGCIPRRWDCDAMIWLQWRIICALSDAGFARYNLGGISDRAVELAHPDNAFHRTMLGFAPAVVRRSGVRWDLGRLAQSPEYSIVARARTERSA